MADFPNGSGLRACRRAKQSYERQVQMLEQELNAKLQVCY